MHRLAYYADRAPGVPGQAIGRAFGMPTTLLVDPQAARSARRGPAEWASQDGLALVRAAIGG